jgi:thymidylate kinase
MIRRQFSPEASSRPLSGEASSRPLSGEAPSRHLFGEELVAAYLADPLRVPQEELPWSTCEVETVLEILQKNKVPLLSLAESPQNRDLLGDPLFQSARYVEEQELAGLRAEYELVKETLASAGIQDVLIKSVGLAPSFPYKSDNLDVLYKPQDIEQVKAVLRDLGYVELKNVEEPYKYLFRKFHAGRSVSAIHVHAHVGWMVSFVDEETLWRRCQVSLDDALVTVPAAEDALLITLAHYFYEDKRVALLDVLKFAHCLRRGVDWDEVYRIATWRGWKDGLDVSLLLCAYQERVLYGEGLVPLAILERAWRALPGWTRAVLEHQLGAGALVPPPPPRCGVSPSIGRGRDSAFVRREVGEVDVKGLPLRIPFVFSKIFFYTKLVRDPTRSITHKLKDLAVHTANGTKLRLHIHSQPAMLVTFSGVDGSGKTTQAKALQSAFHICHLRASHVWSRGGSSRWVGLFTRWSKKQLKADQPMQEAAGSQSMDKVRVRQQRFRSPWLRWGWSWLTVLELLLQYTRHVTLPLLFGRVAICDRYIYDTLADWAAYFGERMAERRLAAKVLRLLTPQPQIGYWLELPAEVAQSRSEDRLPESFLMAQSAAYSRMANLYGLRRLDASRDGEEIADEIVYQVLSTYFSDYHTLINSLFLKNPGQWK